jgi:hypothetical protein
MKTAFQLPVVVVVVVVGQLVIEYYVQKGKFVRQ